MYRMQIFAFFVLVLPQLVWGGYGPPELTEVPGYASMRVCAQGPIYGGYDIENIYDFLGCPRPPVSSCLCREDLRASGSSFLTKSVNSRCTTNANDLTAAVGIWNAYCSRGDAEETSATAETISASTTETDPAESTDASSPGSTPNVASQTVTDASAENTSSGPRGSLPAATTVTQVLVGPTPSSAASSVVMRKSELQGCVAIFATALTATLSFLLNMDS